MGQWKSSLQPYRNLEIIINSKKQWSKDMATIKIVASKSIVYIDGNQ